MRSKVVKSSSERERAGEKKNVPIIVNTFAKKKWAEACSF